MDSAYHCPSHIHLCCCQHSLSSHCLQAYKAKERAKEEAIQEALDQAAAEYAAEAAKLAAVAKEAPKAGQQSKAKSKATRTRPSRKKATQSEDDFWVRLMQRRNVRVANIV